VFKFVYGLEPEREYLFPKSKGREEMRKWPMRNEQKG
jgi:hypothetical protein